MTQKTLKPNGTDKDKSLGRQSVRGQQSVDTPTKTIYRLINEGARLLAQRKAREAAAVLERAYRLDPDNLEVKINLGGAYILLGRFQDAIPLLESAARQAPDNAMVWTNLAAAYLGHLEKASFEQQEAAIAAFKRALRADPRAPHVDYNLGLIYLQRGDLTTALAHFQRAYELNPADKDAAHYINVIKAKLASAQDTSPPASSEDEGSDTPS